jgi:recombinational DNA repair protein RecR
MPEQPVVAAKSSRTVTEIICALSEALAANPTAEAMRRLVEQYHTGVAKIDDAVSMFVRDQLLLIRSKKARSRSKR